MKLKRIVKDIEESALRVVKKISKNMPKKRDMLSTGCTLLNLAISGSAFGGYVKGKYYYLVGDSTSGKTFYSMTCFAEAVRNKHFKDYRLIYDNIEDGMLMNVVKLFGQAVADRVEPPAVCEHGDPVYSKTIEEFYYHLDDALEDGRPFIYVEDSMDGLTSDADDDKFDEQKKAHRAGREVKGTYGTAKAKANSICLRSVVSNLNDSGSILIIISQTRDDPAAGPFRPKKTRSGGHALKFYATVEIWMALGGKIKKKVRKKNREIGNKIKIKIVKNRVTGKLHEVWSAIYPSYGIDDIGSCIDFLIDEGWWKKRKQTIKATELDIEATRPKLIRHIEEEGLYRKLQKITGKCWADIEEQCALERPPRYI